MINIFIAFLFISCSFQLYTISFRYLGINRVVINVPMEVFEPSIIVDENENLFFDRNELKKCYQNYIDVFLKRYSENYTYDYYFYDVETHNECFGETSCKGVEITIDAKIYYGLTYKRTMFYEVGFNG